MNAEKCIVVMQEHGARRLKRHQKGVFLTLSSQSSFTATLLGFKSCRHAYKLYLWHCILFKYELCLCILLKLLKPTIFCYTITMAYFFVKTPAACKVDDKTKTVKEERKSTHSVDQASWMDVLFVREEKKVVRKGSRFIFSLNVCLWKKKKRTENTLTLRPRRSW